MWKSIRRIIQDIYREGEMKAKNAYCDGRNTGRIEGAGGTVLAFLAVGTVAFVVMKAKQSKERKAVGEMNKEIQEDIADSYEEQLRNIMEMHEMEKERVKRLFNGE